MLHNIVTLLHNNCRNGDWAIEVTYTLTLFHYLQDVANIKTRSPKPFILYTNEDYAERYERYGLSELNV
jgi:hypothetical protein